MHLRISTCSSEWYQLAQVSEWNTQNLLKEHQPVSRKERKKVADSSETNGFEIIPPETKNEAAYKHPVNTKNLEV